jgi:hypothetical protein
MRIRVGPAVSVFEKHVFANNDRGAAVLLQDGEDVLEEVDLQCRCGSHLRVQIEIE